MRKEPTCPYCGTEMKLHDMGDIFPMLPRYWYSCLTCHSTSPKVSHSPDAAYDMAQYRYDPPVKPLTWEEAITDDYYLEQRGDEYVDMALNTLAMSTDGPEPGLRDCIHFVTHSEEDVKLMRFDYGKTWRCWPRRPTEEERRAAAWIS